jgi:hypothetical protein
VIVVDVDVVGKGDCFLVVGRSAVGGSAVGMSAIGEPVGVKGVDTAVGLSTFRRLNRN